MAATTYVNGEWFEGNRAVLGPMDHAFWMASVVFDGARAMGGLVPDLDLHCRRVVESAKLLGLAPKLDAAEVERVCREGIKRFPADAELYVRPMFYATEGFVAPDPASTEFAAAVHEAPVPPFAGKRAVLSSYRRPARDMAPTDAKASCLYPNMQRALTEARSRGFDNAITLDPCGNVAELATANLWIVKNGEALTPAWNGTFLNGITRQRVMALLREAGVLAREAVLSPADVLGADEVFSTGNFGKVLPITAVEDRAFEAGPVARTARELYWKFAETQPL